jgi:hypothetical protein
MSTESLAQALHAAERGWLIEQGYRDHLFVHKKMPELASIGLEDTFCGICRFVEASHSPLMVEWPDLDADQKSRYRALAAVQGGAVAPSAEAAWGGESLDVLYEAGEFHDMARVKRSGANDPRPTWPELPDESRLPLLAALRVAYVRGYEAGAARSEAVVQAALVRVADLERELAQEPPNGTLTRRELLALMDRMTLVDLVRVCGRLGFHVSTTIDGEAHPMPKGVWLSLEDAAMVVDWDIPTGTLFVDENRIKGHIRAALAQSTAEGAS